MHITLRQIEVFLATARYGSITAAADMIAMSQSAASSALSELESQLGAPL
ncbi:MAG: LysR family transcriptional regulator, partial [Iodobacter sp.]